jgi:hypothetical protein
MPWMIKGTKKEWVPEHKVDAKTAEGYEIYNPAFEGWYDFLEGASDIAEAAGHEPAPITYTEDDIADLNLGSIKQKGVDLRGSDYLKKDGRSYGIATAAMQYMQDKVDRRLVVESVGPPQTNQDGSVTREITFYDADAYKALQDSRNPFYRNPSKPGRITIKFTTEGRAEEREDPNTQVSNDLTLGLEQYIPQSDARAMADRILNLDLMTRDPSRSGWSQLASNEVRRFLTNPKYGDEKRRQELADIVLTEIEASTHGYAEGQDMYNYWENFFKTAPELDLGAGGGGFQRIYEAPDRREVTENVKNYLAQVLGDSSDKKLVNRLVEIYMTDHRRSFDNPEAGIRPWFSVKEAVRARDDYKQIHKLRPDTTDELEWVTQYQFYIDQAGIPPGLRDMTAVDFATVGASQQAASRGAFRIQEQRTGRAQPVFLNNVRNAISSLARRF